MVKMISEFLSRPKVLFENLSPRPQAIEILKCGKIPTHIGFIMDGNRRYAKEKGLPTKEGHRKGIETLISTLETCFDVGILEVSIYTFSIENFKRSTQEISDYQNLLKDALKRIAEKSSIKSHDVGIHIVGNKSFIKPEILVDLEKIETLANTDKVTRNFNVCFSYTSRDEISNSIREISRKRAAGPLKKDEINEKLISENFYGAQASNPLDLLVRTSGHTRLSDFMLWQCSSDCKIIFLDKYWPCLGFRDLYFILLSWSLEEANYRGNHLSLGRQYSPKHVGINLLPASPPLATVAPLLNRNFKVRNELMRN